jgi:hypothetical protein
MLSGAFANGLANPTDVLKVRMQSNTSHFAKKSLLKSFSEIYSQEGFGGLYRVFSILLLIHHKISQTNGLFIFMIGLFFINKGSCTQRPARSCYHWH